jgi:hypothetical protein
MALPLDLREEVDGANLSPEALVAEAVVALLSPGGEALDGAVQIEDDHLGAVGVGRVLRQDVGPCRRPVGDGPPGQDLRGEVPVGLGPGRHMGAGDGFGVLDRRAADHQ